MGRPRKPISEKLATMVMRFDPSKLHEIKAIAHERNRTKHPKDNNVYVSEVVREIIALGLECYYRKFNNDK